MSKSFNKKHAGIVIIVRVDILNRISFCNQAAAMHKAHIKQVKQLKYALKKLSFYSNYQINTQTSI